MEVIGNWIRQYRRPVIVVDTSGSMSVYRRTITRLLSDLHPYIGALTRPTKLVLADNSELKVVDYLWDYPIPGCNGGPPELSAVDDLLVELEADTVAFVTDGDLRDFSGEEHPLRFRNVLWAIVSPGALYLEQLPRQGRVVQVI